jgi:Secretion system C-terminal sorting domain
LCPITDGIGVYQARTVLEYYTGTPYDNFPDDCDGGRNLDRPVKKKIVPTDSVSFNLFPNPNNGTFTLTYNFGDEKEGRVEIYSEIGMNIAKYLLNSQSGSMTISNPRLSEGIYVYKIYTDSGIKKIGKIIIIK